MFELNNSLIPVKRFGEIARAVVVGESEESLEELKRLLNTLDVKVADSLCFQKRKVVPATYVGRGKLEEAKELFEKSEADFIAFDLELSPNQLRNIEKAIDTPTIDRAGVILEIFSQHARSKEAKTQVQLARLQYLLPRLAHYWSHFERQKGGGVNSKGMGESQIEVDRRLVRDRITRLKMVLKSIEKERTVQRASRKDVYKVALVGYTNAGKSTLLNAMTDSHVLAEDKLFATLDASVRALDPCSHPPIVAVDTVGFISRLPTQLIASFRSTLEEVREADLLLHIVDSSSESAREQIDVVEAVLNELEVADKPRIVILNKADALKDEFSRKQARLICPGAELVSSLVPQDVIRVREKISAYFREKMSLVELMIPYEQSKLEALLHEHGKIEVKRHLEKGTFYRLRMEPLWIGKLQLERFKT